MADRQTIMETNRSIRTIKNQSAPADGQHKDGAGKAKEYGEKFGKKLGNAAIFGAGATLGGNLVNSIF
ncbi:Acetolactate synthase small subunit [Verticillium dahliae VDG1]|nr:Acetolactate synthase small subunit [Verticillium dahliae VDG1]